MPDTTVLAAQFGIPQEAADAVFSAGHQAGLLAAKDNPAITTRPNAGELHAQLSPGLLYEEAYRLGMSPSAFLETLDPSEPGDVLDAFERQLMIAGIRTHADADLGVMADRVSAFYDATPTSKYLLPEFMARTYRAAAMGRLPYMQRFYASSVPVSDVLKPDFIQSQVRAKMLRPSILDAVIALRTGIDSDVYRAFYVTEDEDARQMRRVGEGSELPEATLTGGDHTINLKKYGRALKATYETIRRMTIDRLAFHLSQLAFQAEKDKAYSAVDVAINGDGNSGTAATESDISGLTGGTADQIDPAPWFHFLQLFEDPYKPTVIIGTVAGIVNLLLVNLGDANWPLLLGSLPNAPDWMGGVSLPEPMYPLVAYSRSYAPTDKLVVMDGTKALEMVFEVGADLVETDKIIRAQFDVITMSEVVGFCVLDQLATRILDWGN